MAINDARSPRWRARWGSGGKHRWKHQRRSNGRNTATSPPACASADSGRLRVVASVGCVSKRGCGNSSGNSGDDPRAGTPQNDETSSSRSPCLSSKENEDNTGQAMVLNGARSKGNIGDTPMAETLQPHRLPVLRQTAICPVGCGWRCTRGMHRQGGVWKQR